MGTGRKTEAKTKKKTKSDTKLGRNDPCPCGSGRKYKRCCLDRDEEARAAAAPPPRFASTARSSDRSPPSSALRRSGPSTRMQSLGDRIDAAFELEEEDPRRACEALLEVWEEVKPRLTTEATTFAAWDELVPAVLTSVEWVEGAMALFESLADQEPTLARRGLRFSDEALAHLADEDDELTLYVRDDRVDLLRALGDAECAMDEARAIVRDFPYLGLGYLRVAELLTESGPNTPRSRVEEAIALVESTSRVPVIDADKWAIGETLDELRELRSQLIRSAESGNAESGLVTEARDPAREPERREE